MRPTAHPSDTLSEIMRSQHGIVTVAQALEEGLPYAAVRRLLRAGAWQRLTQGILLTHDAEPTLEQLCIAGVIRGGAGSAIGGWAAAGMLGLRLEEEPPPLIDVWVPDGCSRRTTGRWRFHHDGQHRLARAAGRPATIPIGHVLCDLSAGMAQGDIIDLVTRCLGTGLTDERALIAVVEQRTRLLGRTFLRDLLNDSAGIHSVLEYRFDERVLGAHDLPAATRQASRSGHFHDLLYDDCGVLVELDGRLGHIGSGKFRDFRRDNVSAVNGLVTLRFGWADVVNRPCAVAAQLATVLRRHGWTGRRAYCERCR